MAIEVPDWYRTVALVGVDDTGEPVVVLLDSTGAIMAVVKGEYSGTLKNIAVDASGRVIMIPTDPADIWGNAISMGNAELAARLGYPNSLDNRGQLLLLGNLEYGTSGALLGGDGAGNSQSLSTTTKRFKGLSLSLTPGTDGEKYSSIGYSCPYPVLGKIGLQANFTFDANTAYMVIVIELYDGTNRHVAQARYNKASSKVQYLDSANAWQDLITGVDLQGDPIVWHSMKMVVDLVNKKYHRVLIGGWSWTTGGLSYYSPLSGTSKRLGCTLYHYGDGTAGQKAYVDSIILTQNEPA